MLESRLLAHLQTARPPESPDLYLKARRYKRYYIGICEDGKKILYAFFMCEAIPGWEQQLRHPLVSHDTEHGAKDRVLLHLGVVRAHQWA